MNAASVLCGWPCDGEQGARGPHRPACAGAPSGVRSRSAVLIDLLSRCPARTAATGSPGSPECGWGRLHAVRATFPLNLQAVGVAYQGHSKGEPNANSKPKPRD